VPRQVSASGAKFVVHQVAVATILRFTRNERACLLFRVEDYRQIFNMLKRELVYVRNRMGGSFAVSPRHPNGRCRAWVRQFV
jgi:hypothetical protein